MSSALTARPRYLHSVGIRRSMPKLNLERKCQRDIFYALTRRHTGAAAASGLPAASSNCA